MQRREKRHLTCSSRLLGYALGGEEECATEKRGASDGKKRRTDAGGKHLAWTAAEDELVLAWAKVHGTTWKKAAASGVLARRSVTALRKRWENSRYSNSYGGSSESAPRPLASSCTSEVYEI